MKSIHSTLFPQEIPPLFPTSSHRAYTARHAPGSRSSLCARPCRLLAMAVAAIVEPEPLDEGERAGPADLRRPLGYYLCRRHIRRAGTGAAQHQRARLAASGGSAFKRNFRSSVSLAAQGSAIASRLPRSRPKRKRRAGSNTAHPGHLTRNPIPENLKPAPKRPNRRRTCNVSCYAADPCEGRGAWTEDSPRGVLPVPVHGCLPTQASSDGGAHSVVIHFFQIQTVRR